MQTHKQTHSSLKQTDASGYGETIPMVYLGLCQISEMTSFMGVVECISPPMCGSHQWIIHTQVHWWILYIGAVHYVCGTTFQVSGNATDIRNRFHEFRIGCSAKNLTDDYP